MKIGIDTNILNILEEDYCIQHSAALTIMLPIYIGIDDKSITHPKTWFDSSIAKDKIDFIKSKYIIEPCKLPGFPKVSGVSKCGGSLLGTQEIENEISRYSSKNSIFDAYNYISCITYGADAYITNDKTAYKRAKRFCDKSPSLKTKIMNSSEFIQSLAEND